MDYATTDLVLAIVHHLLVFTLAGILAFEIGTVSLTMKRDEIFRVGRVDNWYGILAGVIIVVGFVRAAGEAVQHRAIGNTLCVQHVEQVGPGIPRVDDQSEAVRVRQRDLRREGGALRRAR